MVGVCVQRVNRILALEVEEMHTTKEPKKKSQCDVGKEEIMGEHTLRFY